MSPSITSTGMLDRSREFFCSDSTTLHVHQWGNIETPRFILLCVQGLGGHGAYYAVVAEALADLDPLVVAPDLRGHGLSEGTRGEIGSFDWFTRDLSELVFELHALYKGIPVLVLAESMGAAIALNFLGKHQPALHGVILLSPVLKPSILPTLKEVGIFLFYSFVSPRRPVLALRGREALGARDPLFIRRLKDDALFIERASVRYLSHLSWHIFTARRRARHIFIPLLILLGEDDRVTDHRATMALYRNWGHAQKQLVEFPSAFHALLFDPVSPDVFKVLRTWIARTWYG